MDSIHIAPSFYFDFNQPIGICDVGAGAGFSKYSVKNMFPQLKVTIVDSLNKRYLNFKPFQALELQLQDVSFIHDRAETFGKGVYISYYVVTARAVARLSVLSELCLPLVKK